MFSDGHSFFKFAFSFSLTHEGKPPARPAAHAHAKTHTFTKSHVFLLPFTTISIFIVDYNPERYNCQAQNENQASDASPEGARSI
jgi:hypothetical protein